MNDILKVGEKIHLIERRYFENDPRRHFVGEIIEAEGNIVRAKGYTWVFNIVKNEFIRRPEPRERIFILGERMVINIIGKETNLDEIKYIDTEETGLIVTDGKSFSLEISEFSWRR